MADQMVQVRKLLEQNHVCLFSDSELRNPKEIEASVKNSWRQEKPFPNNDWLFYRFSSKDFISPWNRQRLKFLDGKLVFAVLIETKSKFSAVDSLLGPVEKQTLTPLFFRTEIVRSFNDYFHLKLMKLFPRSLQLMLRMYSNELMPH